MIVVLAVLAIQLCTSMTITLLLFIATYYLRIEYHIVHCLQFTS
jgi:hypothetical protein